MIKRLSLLFITFGLLGQIILPVRKITAMANNSNDLETVISEMSIEEKVTQTLMPDFRNWLVDGEEVGVTEMNDDIRSILETYSFAGVILFAENVVETEQTARLVYELQAASSLPILIGIDQEGGIVNRLGTGTEMPGNMALGATGQPAYSEQAGEVIARELQVLGINVNFAPVVDVNNNPNNPVIGLRSFSSDPNIVAEHGAAYINGHHTVGIATAAKHFPGHGDTDVDSHYGLPVVDKSLEELRANELIPFQAAVDAEVDLLMTAHIQFPQVDATTYISEATGEKILLPATLSEIMLTDIVRNELNYSGLVITDAMNMEAISANFGEDQATLLAKNAGADIILMPTIIRSNEDLAKLDEIIQTLVNAVETGELPEDNLNQSVLRILNLKDKLGLLAEDFQTQSVEETVTKALNTVGSTEHRATEREIALNAITLLKNEHNTIPIQPVSNDNVLIITSAENQRPSVEFSIERLRNERQLDPEFTYQIMTYDETSSFDDFSSAIDQAAYIIVFTSMFSQDALLSTAYQTVIPESIFAYGKSTDKATIHVSVGNPYDAVHYTNTDVVLISFGYNGMDPTEGGAEPETAFGPNIPAAMEVIFSAEANGQLPVDLPEIINNRLVPDMIAYPIGYSVNP